MSSYNRQLMTTIGSMQQYMQPDNPTASKNQQS